MTVLKQRVLLIFILTLKVIAAQLPEAAKIDELITKDRNLCIASESKIAASLTDLSTVITTLWTTLKAGSYSKDLVTSLDALNTVVKLQKTIKNCVPYVNISTCGDINLKITMMDFERQEYLSEITDTRLNISYIYIPYTQVTAYSGMVATTSHYTSVRSVMTKTVEIITLYSKHTAILAQNFANCAYYSVLLSNFKKSYCGCLKSVRMTNSNNSTLDTNILKVENPLVAHERAIKNITRSALAAARAAYTAVISELNILLNNFYKNFTF